MNRLERILQAIKGKGEELKDVGVNVGEHLGLDLWNFRGGPLKKSRNSIAVLCCFCG